MQYSTEAMITISAGVVATLVALADIFGLIDRIDWVSKRVPKMTLLLLGLFLASQAVMSGARVDEIQASIRETEGNILKKLEATNSSEVLHFRDRAETYRYVADRLRSARTSVDDITWAIRRAHRTESERKAYEDYVTAMEEACNNGDLVYREISALATHHYSERSFKLIEQDCASYHLGYHDTSLSKVPLMSYIIFDSEEVILGFYKKSVFPASGETYLSIKDPNVVRIFTGYYETLWQESVKIKEGDVLNLNVMAQIRSSIAASMSPPFRPASYSGQLMRSGRARPHVGQLESMGRNASPEIPNDGASCLLDGRAGGAEPGIPGDAGEDVSGFFESDSQRFLWLELTPDGRTEMPMAAPVAAPIPDLLRDRARMFISQGRELSADRPIGGRSLVRWRIVAMWRRPSGPLNPATRRSQARQGPWRKIVGENHGTTAGTALRAAGVQSSGGHAGGGRRCCVACS